MNSKEVSNSIKRANKKAITYVQSLPKCTNINGILSSIFIEEE